MIQHKLQRLLFTITSYHLPLHLSPYDGLHVEAALASANTKIVACRRYTKYRLYYEACQRKNRANRWNDCHSRIECPDSKSGIKICWDFVRAIFNTPVWLQAGYYLAIAAQIPAERAKNGLSAPMGVGIAIAHST
jgi:hypothetical protein